MINRVHWGLLSFLALFISSCGASGSPSLQETQVALYVQQTVVARDMAELTQMAEVPAASTSVPPQSTSTFIPEVADSPSAIPDPPTESASSFDSWRQEAKILLYEGITGDPERSRIISLALDSLGQNYFDAASQIGEFQTQLSSDQQWDLIIYARENRDTQSGNPFGEIFSEYDNGSSVIIEHWNLDDILNYSAPFTTKMERCGLVVTADWSDPEGTADLLLYAHNTQNSIHNQPNEDIRLSSLGNTRWLGDIGDFIRLKAGSEGQVLYGTLETTNNSKAAVVSCFDNRFILQSFSTHQYDRVRMIMLWENFIYNALYARYQYLSK
jgi:hypothetical protein